MRSPERSLRRKLSGAFERFSVKENFSAGFRGEDEELLGEGKVKMYPKREWNKIKCNCESLKRRFVSSLQELAKVKSFFPFSSFFCETQDDRKKKRSKAEKFIKQAQIVNSKCIFAKGFSDGKSLAFILDGRTQ